MTVPYLQTIGLLILGATLGFAFCAILQMARYRDELAPPQECEDKGRIDFLEGANLNLAYTRLGDKDWWTLVEGERYTHVCVAHTIRDAIDGAKFRANETQQAVQHG
jgi:hypothetical protein